MATEGEVRAFILKLGRGLHAYGLPAHRLEDSLVAVAERLGIEGQFFSTPTALFASFGPPHDQRTLQMRVEPGGVHLQKLARLHALAAEVAAGRLTPAQGTHEIDAIEAAPPPYGPVLSTIAFALGSGSACRFLGGGWREIALATAIGFLTGLLALAAERVRALARVFDPVAATMAAIVATVAAATMPHASAQLALLGGIIILVPGFPLTVAMTELATRHLVAGTARLAGAAGTFLLIAFGVALGTRVAERLAGEAPAVAPEALPGWTLLVALAVAPLMLTVLLRAEAKDAPSIVAACTLGFGGAFVGARLLGSELGASLGALVVGICGNLDARLRGRPSSVTIVPAVLLLVPGSIGFRSLSSLMERQTLLGVDSAFRMVLVAISLVTGLLVSHVIAPAPSLVGGERRELE